MFRAAPCLLEDHVGLLGNTCHLLPGFAFWWPGCILGAILHPVGCYFCVSMGQEPLCAF